MYSFIQLNVCEGGELRRQITERSFDWGMGDDRKRRMFRAWSPSEKGPELRSSVYRICEMFLESQKGQRNKFGAHVSLFFL